MYVIIAGGGKVGYYLAKTLLQYKHRIIIIETRVETCKRIANDLSIPVIEGDATDIECLKEIGIEKADVFIAVTGKDENNLVACQLAKREFKIARTIARVNNPKNIKVFESLGINTAVSSTAIIADLIEQEVDYAGIKTIMKLKEGKIILNEINIFPDSHVIDKSLKDLEIPKGCIFISVIRGKKVIIPNGFTVLHPDDVLLTVSSNENQKELKEYFVKKE